VRVSWEASIERATRWVYEAARLEAAANARPVVPEPWDERDEAFRRQMTASVGELVERLAEGRPLPSPEEAHRSWCREYERMGWRYGPQRDPVAKTHPDLVPYAELAPAERDKDEIFLELVRFAARWIAGVRPAGPRF
jgi:hypothetical protein